MSFHNSAISELFREFVVSHPVHFTSANSPFSTSVFHFVNSASMVHLSFYSLIPTHSQIVVPKRSGGGAQGTPTQGDLHNNQPLG